MRSRLRDEPPDELMEQSGADTQPLAAVRRPETPNGEAAPVGRRRVSPLFRVTGLAWVAGRLADRPGIWRWAKFATSSGVATVSSAATLTILYGLDLTGPRVATVIAYAAGAVPNYLLSRLWTWRGRSHPKPLRQVIPYLAIILTTTAIATTLTGLTHDHVHLLTTVRWIQVLLVDGVFLGTYAAMFVVKFLFLDRFVFNARRVG
ncbi:MAG: hypothetical protein GEV03_00510 [Streptosporangiales bacterium]|nr:hypothetical protein [Streptosporangiales bacterium]